MSDHSNFIKWTGIGIGGLIVALLLMINAVYTGHELKAQSVKEAPPPHRHVQGEMPIDQKHLVKITLNNGEHLEWQAVEMDVPLRTVINKGEPHDQPGRNEPSYHDITNFVCVIRTAEFGVVPGSKKTTGTVWYSIW